MKSYQRPLVTVCIAIALISSTCTNGGEAEQAVPTAEATAVPTATPEPSPRLVIVDGVNPITGPVPIAGALAIGSTGCVELVANGKRHLVIAPEGSWFDKTAVVLPPDLPDLPDNAMFPGATRRLRIGGGVTLIGAAYFNNEPQPAPDCAGYDHWVMIGEHAEVFSTVETRIPWDWSDGCEDCSFSGGYVLGFAKGGYIMSREILIDPALVSDYDLFEGVTRDIEIRAIYGADKVLAWRGPDEPWKAATADNYETQICDLVDDPTKYEICER